MSRWESSPSCDCSVGSALVSVDPVAVGGGGAVGVGFCAFGSGGWGGCGLACGRPACFALVSLRLLCACEVPVLTLILGRRTKLGLVDEWQMDGVTPGCGVWLLLWQLPLKLI